MSTREAFNTVISKFLPPVLAVLGWFMKQFFGLLIDRGEAIEALSNLFGLLFIVLACVLYILKIRKNWSKNDKSNNPS